MSKEKISRVGIAVLVIKEEEKEVLLGMRNGSFYPGYWAPPGGKKEYYETAKETGLRELLEETGLAGRNIKLTSNRPVAVTEDLFPNGEDFTTLWIRVKYIYGEPKLREPDKCAEWGWFPWDKLPKNLFHPFKNLIKQGYYPFKE